MSAMKEVLIFLYNYYAYYFYVLTGLIGNGIGLLIWKNQLKNEQTTFSRSLMTFLCVSLNFLLAIIVKHHFVDVFMEMSSPYLTAFLLKCTLVLLIGIISVPLIRKLIQVFGKIKIQKVNAMGKLTLLYLLLGLLLYPIQTINDWGALWYATDYSMGFGSRFFIGTVLRLFYNDYLEANVVFVFCLVFTIITIGIVSLFANKLYEECEEKNKLALVYIWALLLVSPGSVIGMWQSGNFGRLEFWGFLIGLVCILVYSIHGLNTKTFLAITILSCISIAIYQGNIFMYYPLICMIFIWEITNSNGDFTKVLFGIINIVLTGISFLLFQFFSYTSFESASEMASFLSEKTNLPIAERAIDLELFQPFSVTYNSISLNFLSGNELPREKGFITIILLCPIIILFIGLYSRCVIAYRKNDSSILHAPYLYFISLLATIIPQFAFNVDWGRWMLSENIVLFSGFIFLLWKKDDGAIQASSALSDWIKHHKTISLVALLWIAGLGKLNASYIGQVNSITDWLISNNWLVVK